jgi:hypothetical protein
VKYAGKNSRIFSMTIPDAKEIPTINMWIAG